MVFLYKLLPNPSGKDTLGEFFIIKNSDDIDIDISNWRVVDYSGKEFIFHKGTTIKAKSDLYFKYSTTKISLNNNGDEIKLFDKENNLVDKIEYGSVKEGECVMHSSQFEEVENCFLSDNELTMDEEITEEYLDMYASMNKLFPQINQAFNTCDIALICLIFSLFLTSVFWYLFKKLTNKK